METVEKQDVKEQFKGYLRDYVERVTKKSQAANMYVCPICGSGTGKNRTGAFSINNKNGTSWTCFSCKAHGDIFDLYGAINGISGKEYYNEQLKGLSELYGVDIGSTYGSIHTNATAQDEQSGQTDYTDFFLQAHKAIEKTDYWRRRGLSKETVDRFKLGYVAEWRHPKAPTAPTSPRLIIPTSPYSYLARDTREQIPEKQRAYSKSKVGSVHIFNAKALKTATKPIFIVEGELDALSIIDVGGEAVALGSTLKARDFITMCKNDKPSQPLIIALDNDAAGGKTAGQLVKGLQEHNIPCYSFNPYGEYKDANDALQCDRAAFAKAVETAERLQNEVAQAQKETYLKNSTAHYLQSFIDGIADSVNTPYIPTGFKKLDDVLDGGLYEGLYILGAISSLGKTTIITQIADQIAQAGTDVLIFSLEMARTEIMAKSISRHTLQIALNGDGNVQNAKTARGITTGKRYVDYTQNERDLINNAIMQYGEYAKNIYISEGIGDIGTEQIRETVNQHIHFTGNTPVVIIDYLQILAPYSERATDKQNIDKAVLELKRISRDYKTPVIGISSFNRANYSAAVTMEAFKESGAIEYSSDVLIGLQLKGAGGKDFDANAAKQKRPREIELVVLKNRNGRTGDRLSFCYYTHFNYFQESQEGGRA